MKKLLLSLGLLIVSVAVCNAQVGGKLMGKMNALMTAYGAKNVSLLKYEARFGLVHQNLTGYTDHYTIRDIKKIVVIKADEGATAQFLCDPSDACISHIGERGTSSYLPSANYYFFQEDVANSFAEMAAEIIRTDFKGTVELITTKGKVHVAIKEKTASTPKPKTDTKDFLSVGNNDAKPQDSKTVEKAAPKKVVDYLSVGAYSDKAGTDAMQDLSPFGKKINSILELAGAGQLNKLKGGQIDGVTSATLKLPKAKKNYLNDYKGEDCFIAEFGTKKYYEDLQDLYYEVKDEIEASLPSAYEPLDMAYEEIYENSDDEVFHTEFYNMEEPTKPSVVIRITPDGKKNTLFLRIGKR